MSPIRKKKIQKAITSPVSPRKALIKKILIWGGLITAGSIALGTLTILSLFLYYSNSSDLPSVEKLRNYKPNQSIRIADRNGNLIGYLGKQRRTVVPFNKIPKVLVHAVISAEDAKFYSHSGLNFVGMFRAFWVNLAAGRYKQGGSTITQQVVKGLLLSPERKLKRKFQEVILARRLDQTLTKDEILSIYLNEIYFGHGRYGVEEASLFYFSKHVWEINAAESALLAGLPQGPEYNSPIRHPKRARSRQLYVLSQMRRHDYISEEVYQKSNKMPLPLSVKREVHEGAPEIIELVRKSVESNKFDAVGKQIRTTIDMDFQAAARKALIKGLVEYDLRKKVTNLKTLDSRKLKKHMEKLKSIKKLSKGRVYEGVVAGKQDNHIIVDLGVEKGIIEEGTERYWPNGFDWNRLRTKPKKKNSRKNKQKSESTKPVINPGDIIRVRILEGKTDDPEAPLRLRVELGPQGAVVLLDARNGDILALIGGTSQSPGGFNRATMAKRQPGSSFKPFIYAQAIASKKFTAATLLNDGPEVYKKWIPRNHGKFRGNITLREAVTHSVNSIAVHVLSKVGIDPVHALVKKAGITSKLGKELSLALGTSEISPLEMAQAYMMFANGGFVHETGFIKSVGEKNMERRVSQRVIDRDTAWIMANILKSVVLKGTGWRARSLNVPVAGKTGTTNQSKDAWFIGFTPDFVCAVYIGYDDHKTLGWGEEGGRTAVPVFTYLMKEVIRKNKIRRDFPMTDGIVTRHINSKTGESVSESAPNSVKEYFLRGTEPEQPAIPVIPDEPAEPGTAKEPQAPEDLLTQ